MGQMSTVDQFLTVGDGVDILLKAGRAIQEGQPDRRENPPNTKAG